MIKGLLKKDLYNLATYKVSLIIIILFCGIAIIGTDAVNIAPAIICGIIGVYILIIITILMYFISYKVAYKIYKNKEE